MLPSKLDLYNLNAQDFTQAQWTEFKKYIDGTYTTLSYTYDDYGGSNTFYLVLTEAWGGLHRKIVLTHGSAEAIDFLTNFATLAPRPPEANATLVDIAEKSVTIQKRYDFSGSTYNYIGTSPLGSATNANVWLIKRITFDGNGDVIQLQWSAQNVQWDNRVATSYS